MDHPALLASLSPNKPCFQADVCDAYTRPRTYASFALASSYTHPHLRQFWKSLGFAKRQRVFVPLCGKTSDMIWLAQQGHTVLGVELSPIAVRDFFREQELSPERSSNDSFEVWESAGIRVLCGDFFNLQPTDLSDVSAVYDRASLIALPPNMRKRYVRYLQTILPAATPSLLLTLEYPQHIMEGPPFAVLEEEIFAHLGPQYRIQLLKTHDALSEMPRFKEKGLPYLLEKVFYLEPR